MGSAMRALQAAPVPTVTVETVTPEIAVAWLEMNTHNRPPKAQAIERYSRDMAAGRWRINGEAIRFGPDVLLDGQNRLWACVEAGVPFDTVVIRGLDADDQMTMDTGVRRSLSDVLKLQGEHSTVALSAALNMFAIYLDDPTMPGLGGGLARYPTVQESVQILSAHPGLRESARFGDMVRIEVGLPVSIGASLHYITTEIDAEDAEHFWARLRDGVGLSATSPILHLREFLRQQRQTRVRGDFKRRPQYLWAITVKSWNNYRDGTEVRALVYRAGGAQPEKYPIPR